MEYGAAFKNLCKSQHRCVICNQTLTPFEAVNCDWNMQKPGKYVFWHKECYKEKYKK